ncbi:MAG: ImmA/IrrE family metallo-endopeptidase [Epsilonproteobacteria bacterium]|nr:ImmA/IrrE family metallo-endopeptidase [Campylobacterota bacterium]
MATHALIEPSVLVWARTRAQMTIDALSAKLSIATNKIELWEEGKAKPTFKQAQKVAKTLQIPFGYLYLSKPPEETLSIPDLRTLGDETPEELSPTFKELLRDMERKQQWYKEYAIENKEEKLPFIGSFNINSSIEDVVLDIRRTLKWESGFASTANVKDAYIKEISTKAEAVGILIMRNSVLANNTHKHLTVSEFRGFAISDNYAPLIFVNTADAKSAQIFTLAHELAHLWIGESGISSIDLYNQDADRIEKFCNKVAAELLIPKNEFVEHWNYSQDNDKNIEHIASKYHVSSFVVIRRAYDLRFINFDIFQELFEKATERFEEYKKENKNGSGGNFYSTLKIRVSERFSHAVVASALEGKLLYKDAGILINMNASKINDYAKQLGIKK